MADTITLETIDTVPKGTHAHVKVSELPFIEGQREENVACGGCGTILAEGARPDAFYKVFKTEQVLVFECTCGAKNVVPKPAH